MGVNQTVWAPLWTFAGGRRIMRTMAMDAPRRTLDEMLDQARARVNRLDPEAALAAAGRGAPIIDIRSVVDRERDGIIPCSIHIPRTVLEWRLDPDSLLRNPHIDGADQHMVLVCDHGYSSLLAAAALIDLGFADVSDVIGGFAEWRDAGLPTARPNACSRRQNEPAGMGPPDQCFEGASS